MGACSVAGCQRALVKKGLCNAHYLRQRRHGRLNTVRRVEPNNCGAAWCPGARKIVNHLDYLNRTDTYKANAEKWRQENPERYRDNLKKYLSREDVQTAARARTREWTKANPEKKRAMDAAFKEANKALVTSYKAARRARVLRATPSWLTPEHWVQIRAVYAEAERLTRETGIEHEVDHIVPLQGKTVCGLHVPWNLRAIPAVQNNRRPRVWTGTEIAA